MNKRSYILVLCFIVVLSARFTIAINSFELHKLMNKLDYLKVKLQDVEQTMKSSLKETEHLKDKLTKHENNMNEKIETIEAKMHEIEHSLKKSVEVSEENTRTKLEELRNHMTSKMDHIQETSQTELQKLGENKEILDMLTNSINNLTTKAEARSPLKETEQRLQEKLTKHEKNINGKMETIEAKMQGMEDSFNKSVTEQFGESKKTLDMLTNSVRNISIQGKLNTRLLNSMHKFGGGWTVIQHRYDGSVDFYRNWTEYRNGFGTTDGEFWLGLEYVHQITKNRPHELLVEMKDFHGNYGYAKYGAFEIGNEWELYGLKKLGTYSGTAGDAMEYHKDRKFSTFDRDNDQSNGNCAERRHGAWWYNSCHQSNLNGRYQNTTSDSTAMVWRSFKDDWRGLSYSRMMIRYIIN